jgi:hypothetical protein
MKSVLEELYYGNIRPFANRREVSEEKQKVLQSIENYHSQLLESLTVEQKHLLEEYESCASEITIYVGTIASKLDHRGLAI